MLLTLTLGLAQATPEYDAAIVPGCPALEDGRLSFCMWRRILWAHHLYEEGLVETFIVSGAAVANPYPEWAGLKAGLVALGVPEENILEERHALHTDENLGFSLQIAEEQGLGRVVVASDLSHTKTAHRLLRGWGVEGVEVAGANYNIVHDLRMARPVPQVFIVPEEDWLPLDERERALADEEGRVFKRRHSAWVYATTRFRDPPAL